jgi:dynein light intermediate chain 1
MANPLQSLIHSSLRIHSLLKRQPLKHNVIDRDKVVVPPNWDSWGKIRVLRDGFDVETVNRGWSLDIEESYNQVAHGNGNDNNGDTSALTEEPRVSGSAVEAFQEIIRDPSLDTLQVTATETNGVKLEVSSLDTQSFLAMQVEVLDKIRHGTESSGMDSSRLVRGQQVSLSGFEGVDDSPQGEGRVNEHIGPIQFNMGGIQVDADDMLQRLKVCISFILPRVKTNSDNAGSPEPSDSRTNFAWCYCFRWKSSK